MRISIGIKAAGIDNDLYSSLLCPNSGLHLRLMHCSYMNVFGRGDVIFVQFDFGGLSLRPQLADKASFHSTYLGETNNKSCINSPVPNNVRSIDIMAI